MLDVGKAREIFYVARQDLDDAIDGEVVSTEESRSEEARFKRLVNMLLSYPDIRPYIRHIMVDVNCGMSESCENETVDELTNMIESDGLNFESILEMTAKIGGALYYEVEKMIVSNEFYLTDIGGGSDGWSLGCFCTLNEADELSTMLHHQFSSAIANGLLSVSWNSGWAAMWKDDEDTDHTDEDYDEDDE